MPRIGSRGRIHHFGGSVQECTVIAIHEQGRRLSVRGTGAEVYDFVLNPATARFLAAGSAHGERLELFAEPEGAQGT
jgi:hypothetical protein